MTDITKCSDSSCPKRLRCQRYAYAVWRGQWFAEFVRKGRYCQHFWPVEERSQKRRANISGQPRLARKDA